MRSLFVHFLPTLMDADALSGSTVVIIDILRASSTITTALANGATRVIPCGSPEAARSIRAESVTDSVLLGGERGGVLIEGFDCGNSPAEYSGERVMGRTIAFTTTNGTRALLSAAQAEIILIGSFLNQNALLTRLRRDQRPIQLVCAGTDGEITGEDVLFAGSFVHTMNCYANDNWMLNDSARIALAFWHRNVGEHPDSQDRTGVCQRIESAMRITRGGVNLVRLGYDHDIRLCSAVDSTVVVPVLRGDALIVE